MKRFQLFELHKPEKERKTFTRMSTSTHQPTYQNFGHDEKNLRLKREFLQNFVTEITYINKDKYQKVIDDNLVAEALF